LPFRTIAIWPNRAAGHGTWRPSRAARPRRTWRHGTRAADIEPASVAAWRLHTRRRRRTRRGDLRSRFPRNCAPVRPGFDACFLGAAQHREWSRRSWCGATVFDFLHSSAVLSSGCRLLCYAAASRGRQYQPVAADAKQHALTLVKHVAGQVKPDPKLPFAIETTIRQLDRYCTSWTQANGFFPGAASDLSLPQSSSAKRCELHGWNGSAGSGRRTCDFLACKRYAWCGDASTRQGCLDRMHDLSPAGDRTNIKGLGNLTLSSGAHFRCQTVAKMGVKIPSPIPYLSQE
jgi:hypothetical protein